MTAASTERTSRAAVGPVQLGKLLGLSLFQFERARAAGDIPAPDRSGGKWSAAVVDELVAMAGPIRARAGGVPDCGANRAAEELADRLGVEVTADGVRELARSGLLRVVGDHKGHRLYDGRQIEAWTDRDAIATAEGLGETLTLDEVAARLQVRPVDVQHLVRAGLLRVRRRVPGQWGSTVALYRAGDVDGMALADSVAGVPWETVRALKPGQRSPWAALPDAPRRTP